MGKRTGAGTGAGLTDNHIAYQACGCAFWHCEECRRHFLEYGRSDASRIQNHREAVLWLWRAHNSINLRVKTFDDYALESPPDPGHVKSLWPSIHVCPQCWVHSDDRQQAETFHRTEFNEHEVYKFLQAFYSSGLTSPTRSTISAVNSSSRQQHAVQQAWVRPDSLTNSSLLSNASPAMLR